VPQVHEAAPRCDLQRGSLAILRRSCLAVQISPLPDTNPPFPIYRSGAKILPGMALLDR
jgi:hypothetical protein